MAAAANQDIPYESLMAFATAHDGKLQLTTKFMSIAAANQSYGGKVS